MFYTYRNMYKSSLVLQNFYNPQINRPITNILQNEQSAGISPPKLVIHKTPMGVHRDLTRYRRLSTFAALKVF